MSKRLLKKKMFLIIKGFISLPQRLHSVKLVIDRQEVAGVHIHQVDVEILVKVFQLLTVFFLLRDMKVLPNMPMILVTV